MIKSKLIAIIFSLISLFSYSQDNNYQIDYIFTKKRTKIDSSKIVEKYNLFIGGDKSIYVLDDKTNQDSLSKKNISLGKPIQSKSIFLPNEVIVFKRNINEITTYKEIMEAPIAYSEIASKNWVLHEKTKKISDTITLHLAELDFGGRKWLAWYSTQYSLSEGPYKFKNLPGLIFELYDSEKIFYFQLSKIFKKEKKYNFNFNKATITTKEKFIEIMKSYVYNPAPKLLNFFTPESKAHFQKTSIERHKNRYYLEKDFE